MRNFFTALVAASALLLSPSAFAKKKPADFSNFKGNYKGTVVLVIGTAYIGSATATISVPKNGKSATLTYSALVSIGGMTLSLPTTIALTKNGTVSVSDVGVGLGSGTLYPATGSYQAGKGKFSFTVINPAPLTFLTQANVKDQGKKRKLSLVFTLFASGNVYTFTNTLTAKVPKGSGK